MGRAIADDELHRLRNVESETGRQFTARDKLGRCRNQSGIHPAQNDENDEIRQSCEPASRKYQLQEPERRAESEQADQAHGREQ